MNMHEPPAAAKAARRAVAILVPTDFSALAQLAVDAVLSRVKDRPGVRVTLLHVVEPCDMPGLPGIELPAVESLPSRKKHAEHEMERLRSRYDTDTQARIDARVLTGNPARVICDAAHHENFRAIVLSSHGHAALVRMFIGSVAERVVQDAACPVLVVKPRKDKHGHFITEPSELNLQHLLVGYDHRRGSKRALVAARAIARRTDTSLTLVHAIEPPVSTIGGSLPSAASLKIDEACSCLRQIAAHFQHGGRPCDVKVEPGHPWDVIIDAAKACKSDLIIVGPHEHTRWGHSFVGSTAQRVVRLAPCSVLAMK